MHKVNVPLVETFAFFKKKTKQKTIYIGIEMLVFWATWWQSFD